jgi:asparagine synthase (glutamine-hydrolysing)
MRGELSASHGSIRASDSSDGVEGIDGMLVALVGLPSFSGALIESVAVRGVRAALVDAYRRDGLGMLDDVHGTFSLAIIDLPKRELILAVDRLGVSTLCFGIDGERIVFSMDAGGVAAALRGDRASNGNGHGTLDAQAIFDYLYSHCIPGPATVYRGVTRLLPGHVLRCVDGRATVVPYWEPRYEERIEAPLAGLEADFLGIVRASTARAIDGAKTPGCFLSGGTDSSTVAGMLTEVTGRPAETYSIGFDAEGFDEMHYARIASKRYGTVHHEYYITPSDLVRSIPDIAAAYDQPFGNSSVLPTYYCAKMAAADGIDRMLGGDGGDELFGGNTRYAKQRVFDYFSRSPSLVRSALRRSLAPAVWDAVPVVRKAKSYVQQADVPMPDRMQTYNLLARIGVDRIFEPDFLAQVDTEAPIKAMRAWYARSDAQSLVNRMLAFDLKYTLTDNDLPKVVTACHLAGVDVAFPFLDDAVVAFAERLDPDLKLKGLKLRWFFKHALRDFLPPEILTKSKHGFGLPFGIWLGRDRQLRELAFASLESMKERGIVRVAFVDQLRADLLDHHATYYGELVWVLMMLEQWLKAHEAA